MDGETERRTNMMKLKDTFRNFANSPKNEPSHIETDDFPPGERKPGFDHVREWACLRECLKKIYSTWFRILSFCLPVASHRQDTAL